MKRSKIFISVLFAFLFSALALAEESAVESDVGANKYITKGHWTISGGASLSYNTGGSGANLAIYPSAQYFVMDHLSVGGEAFVGLNSSYNTFGLGPAMTYYFGESERAVWFVSQAILYNRYHYDAGSLNYTETNWSSHTSLGMNYFLTPSVAVGPRAVFNWNSRGADTMALMLGLQVYF
jgi:hypothetical protein